jgi:hypothetical protein
VTINVQVRTVKSGRPVEVWHGHDMPPRGDFFACTAPLFSKNAPESSYNGVSKTPLAY